MTAKNNQTNKRRVQNPAQVLERMPRASPLIQPIFVRLPDVWLVHVGECALVDHSIAH